MSNANHLTDEQYKDAKEKLKTINAYYRGINNRGITFGLRRAYGHDQLLYFDAEDKMRQKIRPHTIIKKVEEEYKIVKAKLASEPMMESV